MISVLSMMKSSGFGLQKKSPTTYFFAEQAGHDSSTFFFVLNIILYFAFLRRVCVCLLTLGAQMVFINSKHSCQFHFNNFLFLSLAARQQTQQQKINMIVFPLKCLHFSPEFVRGIFRMGTREKNARKFFINMRKCLMRVKIRLN